MQTIKLPEHPFTPPIENENGDDNVPQKNTVLVKINIRNGLIQFGQPAPVGSRRSFSLSSTEFMFDGNRCGIENLWPCIFAPMPSIAFPDSTPFCYARYEDAQTAAGKMALQYQSRLRNLAYEVRNLADKLERKAKLMD